MLKALDRTQEEYMQLTNAWLILETLNAREQELVFHLWQAARDSLDTFDGMRHILLRDQFFPILYSAVAKAREAGIAQ